MEAALCLLTFLTLLIGFFDVGRVLFVQIVMTERVRDAVRYGCLNADNLAGIQNMVLWGNSAQQPTTPTFGLTRDLVQVTRSAEGTTDERITVIVSGHRLPLVTPGLAGNITTRPIMATAPVERL